MNFLSLIESKRDGQILSPEQIKSFIGEFVAGKIPDYQMASMLMAIFFRGLDLDKTRALTLAMRDSGDVLKFPNDSRPLVDKHSTGGVGDKVSLPLAPLLACLGFRVPMISGRGLGITGGTLDKLESIPGFKTSLSAEQIISQVQKVGCVICGQTQKMVPADKAIYALRDVTATVPSIPLITSSILSKKLAEGLEALVLDVKFGAAAFMQTKSQARELAQQMVALGNECGVHTRALLTNMDRPLGWAAGNWLEVSEAVDCLEGRGPKDLQELVVEFAAHLLLQTHSEKSLKYARDRAAACLVSGQPRKKWDEMLFAQGADLAAFQRKREADVLAPVVQEFKSPQVGFLKRCNARVIGEIVRDLGGGRLTKESVIDPDVGLDDLAQTGDRVNKNLVLARVHARTVAEAEAALARLPEAFEFSSEAPEVGPLIENVIG